MTLRSSRSNLITARFLKLRRFHSLAKRPNYWRTSVLDCLEAWLPSLMVLIVLGLLSCNSSIQQQPHSAEAEKKTNVSAPVNRPPVPPPRFRVYRSKMDEGTSVVVSPTTTDEQLRSLLWFFREKVRSRHFKDIGINQPTSKQWGKNGYLSGTISVYRGEKCAGEYFLDYKGPCSGPDTHEAAFYQWGMLVDGVFNTDADSAGIYSDHGQNLTVVFDYKDNWQLPPSLQAELDEQKKLDQEKGKLGQVTRKMFAEQLQSRMKASGFDITVWAGDQQSEELVLDSDIFKDTATRVQFLHDVLPNWRHDLCTAGFRQVRLIRGGIFSTGDAYSIGCK